MICKFCGGKEQRIDQLNYCVFVGTTSFGMLRND